RMLAEDGDLEVVPPQPAYAAPTRERSSVEHDRAARGGLGIQLVPPAVGVRGSDGQRRHGDECGRGGWGGEPEQPLPASPCDRRRHPAREEGNVRAESDAEME